HKAPAPALHYPPSGASDVPSPPTKRTETKRKAGPATPLQIPDKLYFRIGEVSKLLDLPPYVLRFWETEFPQLKPGKGGTGQRLYRRRDVETLAEIRRLLYDEGYTIPGARQALKGELKAARVAEAPAPEPEAPKKAVAEDTTALRLRKLRSDLNEIASLLDRPLSGQRRPHAGPHRGLSVAPRRRAVLEMPPSLFATTPDPPAE
ncbi:MAG: MerR family transcriptional regulator, partial [Terriglobus sp.]